MRLMPYHENGAYWFNLQDKVIRAMRSKDAEERVEMLAKMGMLGGGDKIIKTRPMTEKEKKLMAF